MESGIDSSSSHNSNIMANIIKALWQVSLGKYRKLARLVLLVIVGEN
jgi:hypothetical protein